MKKVEKEAKFSMAMADTMTTDILYEIFKKIPGVTDREAHEASSRLSRSGDFCTKADLLELKAELIDRIARLETKLAWGVVAAVGIILAGIRYL